MMHNLSQKSASVRPTFASKPKRHHARPEDPRIVEAGKFLLPTYKRPSIVFTRGKGCYVFDADGKKYLDFLCGIAVNALGHAHPQIVKIIRCEASRAIHFSNLFHNAYQGPLARKLCELSGLDRVFFANSGTEAIDGALKLARLSAKNGSAAFKADSAKHRILAMTDSFHGRTFGATSVTAPEKYRLPFAPLVPGVEFVRFNDVADLKAKCDDTVCAIVLETVQGEGGIHAVSREFWNAARELATRHRALLIADEIQCGLGRTGRTFAYQKFASKPDIAVVAKPLAAGLPLAAILTSEAVAAHVSPGIHGTTFGGGPLVCAVALEFLSVIEKQDLLANVRARSAELMTGLHSLSKKFDLIREVRGEGLMIGIELSIEGAPFVAEAMSRGLLINCTHDFTLRILPPFILTRTQVREFLRLFETVLAVTGKLVSRSTSQTLATDAGDSLHVAQSAAR